VLLKPSGLSLQEKFQTLVAENEKKIADYDVHLRKKEERCSIVENELRQRVQGELFNCRFL
jgi:hypothetical protein